MTFAREQLNRAGKPLLNSPQHPYIFLDHYFFAIMTNHFIQAYKQAPWRLQLQWIGLFLLGLVLVASVASVYLNVSAKAAATGREIQRLEETGIEVTRSIADLETQLAALTSAATMGRRAVEMGFQPVATGSAVYVKVPGYAGRQPAILAPPPGSGLLSQPLIRPAYTQSLWEWLFQDFINPLYQKGVVPR